MPAWTEVRPVEKRGLSLSGERAQGGAKAAAFASAADGHGWTRMDKGAQRLRSPKNNGRYADGPGEGQVEASKPSKVGQQERVTSAVPWTTSGDRETQIVLRNGERGKARAKRGP